MLKSIFIIGGGQMGASIARGALERQSDAQVNVIEPNAEYRNQLSELLGSGANIFESVAAANIEDADLVILATPISTFANITDEIAGRLKDGAVITDVGSAKYTSIKHINEALDRSGRNDSGVIYIPSHPGVGNSGQGPLSSSSDMYRGNPVFVVPPGTEASSEKMEAFNAVKAFWDSLGADTTEIDAFSHDRFFGTTSHFQHVAVFALSDLGRDPDQSELIDGYHNARTWMRNTTRISKANPDMWVPVFDENTTAIL